MFSGNYGEDGGLLGLGLVEYHAGIFRGCDSYLSLFLIIAALSFYQKRKIASSGLVKTLGIRKRAFFWSSLGELLGLLCCSVSLRGDGGNGSFVFLEKWVCCLDAGV